MFAWTPSNFETAVRLWREGKSSSEIGKTLGITRSAVLGKLWREGIRNERVSTPRPVAPRPAPKARTPKVYVPLPKSEKVVALRPLPTPKKVTVMDQSLMRPWEERKYGQCAYPTLKEGVTYSCCNPTDDGKPYCEAHRRVMYVQRKEAA